DVRGPDPIAVSDSRGQIPTACEHVRVFHARSTSWSSTRSRAEGDSRSAAIGPEATLEGASVVSGRRAQGRIGGLRPLLRLDRGDQAGRRAGAGSVPEARAERSAIGDL